MVEDVDYNAIIISSADESGGRVNGNVILKLMPGSAARPGRVIDF